MSKEVESPCTIAPESLRGLHLRPRFGKTADGAHKALALRCGLFNLQVRRITKHHVAHALRGSLRTMSIAIC